MALSNAILEYAKNIDNMDEIRDTVKIITHKHVSLDIKAEYFKDVGTELLKSIKEILGDAATEEILHAWKEAYFFLADILIENTENMQTELESKGGWIGFEKFKIDAKIPETSDIASFYLKRANGKPLLKFKAGQYLSIRFPKGSITNINYDILRNYSLSCGENSDHYRITVKKEAKLKAKPGIISNFLHNNMQEGDELEIGMPCGTFNLKENERPIVLLGGGIGVTPLMSFFQTLISITVFSQI